MKRAFRSWGCILVILSLLGLFPEISSIWGRGSNSVIATGDNVKSKLVGEEDGKKVFITELTGNPRIKYKDNVLRANKIIIRGSEGEIVEAIGKVLITEKRKGSIIRSKRAVYYKFEDRVEITGNPSIITRREDDNSKVHLKANRVEYDIDENVAHAFGSVNLKNRDIHINSQRAVLERSQGVLTFLEKPIMRRGEEQYRADEIIYHTKKKLFILNRNAHVITFSEERDPENGEKRRVKLIASGDRIEHLEDGEKLTKIIGNGVIEKEDTIFRGDEIEIVGEDGSMIEGVRVAIDYRAENVLVYGNRFRYYQRDGYSSVWDNAHMVIVDDEAQKRNTKIYGHYMEFFQDLDELLVNGDVSIYHDSEIIRGDMARFTREERSMYITGNSRVEKGESVVFADTIIYNTKSRDTRLIGDLKGNISRARGM
ncbi:MAG: LptA/OstA family protein [Spirochaetota bacterium]|nr:LptA/OstA family protein [Spirochaetota bacterium]